MTQSDLFAPALALAGLDPDRVIYVEARDETSLLSCFEEGLRHGGLGGVIAEAARLSMTASRRLQLAAESTGTIGIAIRRWRRAAEASAFGPPTAAAIRWPVTSVPPVPLTAARKWRGKGQRWSGRVEPGGGRLDTNKN